MDQIMKKYEVNMMTDEKYTSWIPFYMEFADILLRYAEDRIKLIEKIKKVYSNVDMKLPTLERGMEFSDIDPFTVFGLFNKGTSQENRIRILNGIAEEFSVKAPVPECFDGVPVLNNKKTTFYWFNTGRGENDIQNLWNFFKIALAYADDPHRYTVAFEDAYDTVAMQKGVKWNLTMGLFWIRPYVFMTLDSHTRWFCAQPIDKGDDSSAILHNLEDFPSSGAYVHMIVGVKRNFQEPDFPYKSFPEISYLAWEASQHKDIEDGKKIIERDNVGHAIADQGVETKHYWLYAPGDGACMWDEFYNRGVIGLGWGEIGDLSHYSTKEEMKQAMKQVYDPKLSYMNSAHATWQFANEMKPGDVVFVKKGLHNLIGMGTITSDYYFDGEHPDTYKHYRKAEWSAKGMWPHPGQAAMKTLTDITLFEEYVQKLLALFREQDADDHEVEEAVNPIYTKDDFLSEVFMPGEEYDTLVNLLGYKKNIILQGAPGVGKTFAAKRLAYSIMGEKDPNRVAMIQFHQSYSYEDFIVGFRPDGNGFKLNYGPFYNFCKKAEIDLENPYFFIIDEINRGNLSKIFGELFMLIEKDKRGIPLQLLYSDEKFTVPKNVHIIGMMNTADRSLALLDYALRRRFAFYNMVPAFTSKGFKKYLEDKNNEKLDKLIGVVQQLNAAITKDDALGPGFCIGHSYFCTDGEVGDVWLRNVVNYELIPLLDEYWYDEPDKVQEWVQKLREAIK